MAAIGFAVSNRAGAMYQPGHRKPPAGRLSLHRSNMREGPTIPWTAPGLVDDIDQFATSTFSSHGTSNV